jgi:hypothetical protein
VQRVSQRPFTVGFQISTSVSQMAGAWCRPWACSATQVRASVRQASSQMIMPSGPRQVRTDFRCHMETLVIQIAVKMRAAPGGCIRSARRDADSAGPSWRAAVSTVAATPRRRLPRKHRGSRQRRRSYARPHGSGVGIAGKPGELVATGHDPPFEHGPHPVAVSGITSRGMRDPVDRSYAVRQQAGRARGGGYSGGLLRLLGFSSSRSYPA